MGQERKLFKSEEPKQRSEVSEFLHQIAAKIEAGRSSCARARRRSP